MDKKTIGIVVKNDSNDILYHENNFFIEVEIKKEDSLRFVIEDKLTEVLEDKAFRVDKISKKIPKLNVKDQHNDTKEMTMYLITVYMYSHSPKFISKEYVLDNISKEYVLDNISNPLYKDYYLKNIIRREKYSALVECSASTVLYTIFIIGMLSIPLDTRTRLILDTLFNPFWLGIILYILIPVFIIFAFIVPMITNRLVNYDISPKIIKIGHLLNTIAYIGFFVTWFRDIWVR